MTTLLESAKLFTAQRKKTFGHDRRLTVGASEVGKCLRATAARKQGWAPDPGFENNSGFTVRGDVIEDAWSAPLAEFHVKRLGGELLYAGQSNQVTLKADKVPLSATPDGLAIRVPRNFLADYGVKDIGTTATVLEFKSLDDRFDKTNLPKFEHVAQTITQLGMIRRALKHKPKWGSVWYVDTSDWWNIDVKPVEYSEDSFRSLLVRANRALTVKDPNQLQPEGKMAGGKECRTCEFASRCFGFLPWLQKDAKKVSPKLVAEIVKLRKLIQKAEVDKAKAEDRRVSFEAEMFATLARAKTNFVKLPGGGSVIAKRTASQMRINQKKLVEAAIKKGIDVEALREPTKPGATLEIA